MTKSSKRPGRLSAPFRVKGEHLRRLRKLHAHRRRTERRITVTDLVDEAFECYLAQERESAK